MGESPRTKRRLLRNTLIVMAVTGFVFSMTVLRWINVPAAQHRLLGWISTYSKWEIAVDHWTWHPITSTLIVHDLSLTQRKTRHHAFIDRIALSYSPWALLRGVIKIRSLDVRHLLLRTQHMQAPTDERTPITLKKLLLLRNLHIAQASITDVTNILPNDYMIRVENVRFRFQPEFLRGVALDVQIRQPQLLHHNKPVLELTALAISGRTNLRNWVNVAPFVNDINGALSVQDIRWERLHVSSLTATASLLDSRLGLKAFETRINERALQGDGFVEFATQRSGLHLTWPEPMPIPELLKDTSFIQSAGTIQGHLDWKGESFDPARLRGDMQVDLTHVPDAVTDIPAHFTMQGKWQAGVMQVKKGVLRVGEGNAAVTGTLDLPRKKLAFDIAASQIPILGVLGRFRNVDFHPVTGLANCKGKFRGWAHNFTFGLEADTASPSTYQGITIAQARVQMQLTYPGIKLHGEILQDGQRTGTLDYTARYGPRRTDGTREAIMRLTGEVANHRLDPSFAHVALRGVGGGKILLEGPSSNYRGTAEIHIANGALDAVPLEDVTATLQLRPKQITFVPATIKIPNVPPIEFTHPLVMSIDHGFRLKGTPTAGLTVDLAYASGSGQWTFHTIRFVDPHIGNLPLNLTGTARTGQWHIQLAGTANGKWLEYVPMAFREAEGPLPLRLAISGNLDRPHITGQMTFAKNRMMLRDLPQEWSDLTGTLHFQGSRIALQKVEGFLGEGPFTLTGWVEQQGFALPRFDLALNGLALDYISDDRVFRATFDADTRLHRMDGHTTQISGSLALIDALYTRDFRILEHVTRTHAQQARERLRLAVAGYDDIHLDLQVRSRGEILVRNNAADLALRAKVHLQGTMADPQVRGTIETTEGTIHYLGLEFDVLNGIVEFHPPVFVPFVEFTGEETIGTHLVRVTLRGPTNNLRVDLTSTPGEDRKNILCIIAYGSTCDQLRQAQFGAKIGPGVFMEQIGKLLERPLTRLTGLDVVRVESAVGTADVSRLQLGKRINDRLEVSFVTSVGQSATTEKSFEAAYQLSDFLLLKARKNTDDRAQVNMSVRLRER